VESPLPTARLRCVLVIRLAGFFFAIVQITLVLRLALPFVEVPEGLEEFVPPLVAVTDLWLAPVETIIDRFEVSGLAQELAQVGDDTITGPEEFEPIVLVAMLFWGVAAAFVLFVLRLIFRPAG
jgi:hypothetical protein